MIALQFASTCSVVAVKKVFWLHRGFAPPRIPYIFFLFVCREIPP